MITLSIMSCLKKILKLLTILPVKNVKKDIKSKHCIYSIFIKSSMTSFEAFFFLSELVSLVSLE